MSRFRDRLGRLNRLQQSTKFKVGATIALVALTVVGIVWYAVSVAADRDMGLLPAITGEMPAEATQAQREAFERARSVNTENVGTINQILRRQASVGSVAASVLMLLAVVVGVTWLGLLLTGMALGVIVAALILPLYLLGNLTVPIAGISARDLSLFLGAAAALTASYAVLLALLRLAMSGGGPVMAIARNVVNEAVRMKVSLVFIVMLIIALAALPGLLHDDNPLRYRMQSFLQYSIGGTFWIIAVLAVFLSTGTVAFEQRDRIIWQTATKPVPAWKYLLGKWVGVCGVTGMLLAVSASGVFMFSEYLRSQPAVGEVEAYRPADGSAVTEDRVAVETQVCVARASRRPMMPEFNIEAFEARVDTRLQEELRLDPALPDTPETRRKIAGGLIADEQSAYLAVSPAKPRETFRFGGLGTAKDRGRPLTLRFKINAGGNDPRLLFRLTFRVPNAQPAVIEAPPNQPMTWTIMPSAISERGVLEVEVLNGDWRTGEGNAETIAFPPDGLEVFYETGSYRLNFARVIGVLWLKLAFLSMVGVAAATFLSFSVASLVSFGTFFVAESSGFLLKSLEYYSTIDDHQNIIWYRAAVRVIAVPIANAFRFYSEMSPVRQLVEGRLVPVGLVMGSIVIVGVLCGAMFAGGVAIFRKRELATYSGA